MTERHARAWSVRARIIASVTLLTGLALAGAGAVVFSVESERLEEVVVSEIDQEMEEFNTLRERGIDPRTGQPFRTGRSLLRTFLQRNVPTEDEILVAWYDDRARQASPRGDAFVQSAQFSELVTRLVADNGTARVDAEGEGETIVAVQSVSSQRDPGALVIVKYLERTRADLVATMRTYALVALVSLAFITAVGAWQSGRLLAPLRVLRETTDEITETDLARRLPEVGNDDITALTRTVNGMLARLEAAFVDQRRFLDDAGHELRTPLTVLQGHLELLDEDDPEEVAETRALLLDEVTRMSRLVGDLILLAKHDRPDFLAPAPVSVERLTHTLLAKARGMAERDWQLDGAGEGIAHLDEQRITQAMLQLVDNAVKHTGHDDVIAIGSAVAHGQVRLWVRDTGPGVPEPLRDHVFERFGRAENRAGDEGFGLGLSIVRAIARAHGGSVDVTDAEPPGALFTIRIPQEHPWPAS